jgi:microcystin-dependent protein
MSQPFIGEVRMFAGNFAPDGWAFCNGETLPIAEYSTLFNLIGTTYGGDGETTFGLPDLQGRLPLHQGGAFLMGQIGGAESVTLSSPEIPAHTHPLLASQATGNQAAVSTNVLAGTNTVGLYNSNAPNQRLSASAVANSGSSQPHDNFQPYLCLSFIISLFGIYPTES